MDPSMDDPMSEEEEEVEDDDDDGLDLPAGSDEGVVMEGVEIAEEDIYAYGDPDDPLDRVLDVYLADELEDHLYLLQYPMRPADRPSSTPLAVKVKVGNHLLEVEHAIKQGGKHFDKNAPPQLRQATQKHTGSRVRPATNFAFGVVRNNEFHLTPVHATMQMRPCFQHIDDAKALEIEMDLDDPENGGAKAEERPQQVSFKKKESERATAARKSTYAYKKSIEDAEPWVPLEVHGQNDQRSLDEFARMFSDHDDASGGGSTAKDFPAPERYLKGLDYMEEYDENGESFSVGGGRSLDDSIDLVAPGASTYSPVKIPSAPLQQLGGEAKIVGYLKLAHLVPFSVLLDVTKSSPDAVIRALSVEGRQRGLLVRGNWAAHAADVWPKGPPHAADCLSVAQLLIHRYGAVSRPDLQRRFPELGPVVLKEVLANIAELDTVGRRWVAKLKDGVSFGMEYCDIVELEEERWMIQASSLKERLGEDILAPPSCQTFEPFAEVLVSAATARVEFPSPVLSSVPALPISSHRSSAAAAAAPPAFGQVAVQNGAGSAGGSDDEFDELMLAEHLRPSEEFKEISKAGAGSGASSAGPAFAPKRHFKPKKRVPKPAGGGGGGAVKETRVKLEHEEVEGENGGGAASGHSAGVGSSEGGVPEAGTDDQEAATEAEVVGGNGDLAVEEEVPPVGKGVGRRSRRNAPAVAESDEVTGGDDAAALSEGENEGVAATAGLGASGSVTGVSSVGRGGEKPAAMPLMAKEEPREKCAEPMEGVGAGEGGVVDATGEGGAGSAGAEKGAGAGAKKGKGKVKAKEEPAPRPRIRPRTRPKPKAK